MMADRSSLETPRLLLRPWRDTDLEPFAAMNADPRVMEFFPALLDRAQSDALAARIRGFMADNGWGLWALELKESGEFLGFTGLARPVFHHTFTPCVEVGWRIAAVHWGHGYVPEAAAACLDFGFRELGLAEIVSFTSAVNLRSIRVMEKIGLEKRGEFGHPNISEENPLRRHVLYGKRAPVGTSRMGE